MKLLIDEGFSKTSHFQIKNAGFEVFPITLDYAGITELPSFGLPHKKSGRF